MSAGGEEGGGGTTMAGPPKLTGEEHQAAAELRFPNRKAQEKEESEASPFPTQTRPVEADSMAVGGGTMNGLSELVELGL